MTVICLTVMLTYRLMKPPWCSLLIHVFPISDSDPGYQRFSSRCSTRTSFVKTRAAKPREKNLPSRGSLWRLETGNREWKVSGAEGAIVRGPEVTQGARGFSCAVSGFESSECPARREVFSRGLAARVFTKLVLVEQRGENLWYPGYPGVCSPKILKLQVTKDAISCILAGKSVTENEVFKTVKWDEASSAVSPF